MAPANEKTGLISWADLTVENADEIRDFYQAVVGWQPVALEMSGYSDYCMNQPAGEKTVAGICHARGQNAKLPPVWLVYITVADLDASIAKCLELGGELVAEPRSYGGGSRYCVIRDPAGAVAALYQEGSKQE